MRTIKPHDYQKNTTDAAYALAVHERKSVLIVSPGASGKTVMAAELARRAVRDDREVLLLAQRRELVTQAYAHLRHAGLAEKHLSVIMADSGDYHYDENALVHVASIDTLRTRVSRRKLSEPAAKLILVDEAQHVAAPTYRKLLARHEDAAVIGLTATPYRLDGKPLGDVFDELLVAIRPSQLIERGLLATPRMFVAPDDYLPVLDGVSVVRGDYAIGELEQAVNRSVLIGNIVENWKRHGAERRTIVFAVSILHSQSIVARFCEAGVKAAHIDGTMSTRERDRLLRSFRTGDVTVLSNCMVLSEGYDLPACKVIVLARPTRSLALFQQQAARAARQFQHVRPILLDHARGILMHGPPHLDREFSLDGSGRYRPGHEPPIKVCPNCGAVAMLAERECPECGHVFIEEPQIPAETDETLVELTEQERDERRQRLEAFAREKGYPPEWVIAVLEKWFGGRAA